jgi:hypothetical protein
MTVETLDILRNAVAETLGQVKAAPTAENLRNWQEAAKALRAAEEDGRQSERAKGITGAVRYLNDQGWKISISGACKHRDNGQLPLADVDGFYAHADLDRYAAATLRRRDGTTAEEDDQADDDRRANDQDTASLKSQQAENWRLRNEILRGAYVERSFMEREFGSRAAFLRTDLNTFWEVHALTIVELVGGDPAKVPALVEKGQDWVRDWTDRYARAIKYPEPKAPGRDNDE